MSSFRHAALLAALLVSSGGAVAAQKEKGAPEKAPPAKAPTVKEAPAKEAPSKEAPGKGTPAKEKAKETPKETPPPPEPQATAEQFPELYKRWQELEARLNDLAQQFDKAPSSEEKSVIRGRYAKLVQEMEKLLPQLRSAGEAAFAAAPGKDPDVTKIMIGLVAYEYRRDDYDAAVKLAQALFDAQVTEPVLYALAGAAAYQIDDYDQAEKWLTTAKEAKKLDVQATAQLNEIPKRREAWAKEQEIRKKEAEAGDLPRVKLETSKGTIVVELFENEAPQTVANFISLVEAKKYDGTIFHRVLPGFMAQGGDPQGNGSGGPGYKIFCECYREDHRDHFRGSLSMAHAGKDTGGSQFFLTFRATTHLDGKHTVFGRVVEGLDVLPKLQRRNPDDSLRGLDLPAADKIVKAEVLKKREHEYKPTKVEEQVEPAKGKEKTKAKDDGKEKADQK